MGFGKFSILHKNRLSTPRRIGTGFVRKDKTAGFGQKSQKPEANSMGNVDFFLFPEFYRKAMEFFGRLWYNTC